MWVGTQKGKSIAVVEKLLHVSRVAGNTGRACAVTAKCAASAVGLSLSQDLLHSFWLGARALPASAWVF